MDDLVTRLERNSGWRDERWQCVTDPALLTEAAARIQALETLLAEAEGRVIAEVVAWLREQWRTDMGEIECFDIADAIEAGEWRNAQSV